MTTRTLPQKYCPALVDHPAHTARAERSRDGRVWCPGRHTPNGFVTDAPIAHPMDSDPFAGIPGAHDED